MVSVCLFKIDLIWSASQKKDLASNEVLAKTGSGPVFNTINLGHVKGFQAL